MLISELARRTNLHPATLRRLEMRGLLVPERDANGWRVYGPDAVKVLRNLYKRHDEAEGK
jgi:DNA-binding transcriptional MerR regulator